MASWTWAAASRRGSAHTDRGERRQDAFRVVAPADNRGFLVLAACDGAGSSSHGGEGASLAARTITECARVWLTAHPHLPDAERVASWALLARLRIAGAALLRGLSVTDFATTTILAISDGASTLTAHVGDGVIVARDATSGDWLALSWPEHGDYAATTFFLTDDGAPRLRLTTTETPIDRLAVLTDGLERLALDFTGQVPHAQFFDGMSAPLAASGTIGYNRCLSHHLAAFLDSEQVLARTDDDKTLLLAARA